MQFDTAILTEEGVRLLTTASLDDKLVLTKFLFAANPFEPSPDLTTLPNMWGDGHVETQRTEGGVIHVDASASNRLTSGRAYGFGIWGYLSSEGAETGERLLLSAKAIDPVVEVTLASGAWTIFRIHVAIQFAPPSADAIIVEPSYNGFVSIDAFNRLEAAVDALEERVVTTHAKGNATVGDDQIVLGNKTFQSDVFEWYTHAGNSGDRSTIRATKDIIYFESNNIVAQGYSRAYVNMLMSYNEDTPTSNFITLSTKQDADTDSGDSTYKSLQITNRGIFGYAASNTAEADALRFHIGRKPTKDGDYSHRFVGNTVLDSLDTAQMRPDGIPLLAPRINFTLKQSRLSGPNDKWITVTGCGTTINVLPTNLNDAENLLNKTSDEILNLERAAKPGIIGYANKKIAVDQNTKYYSYIFILRYTSGRIVDPLILERNTNVYGGGISYGIVGSHDANSENGTSYTSLLGVLNVIKEDIANGMEACWTNYAWRRSVDGAEGYITVHEINYLYRDALNEDSMFHEIYA